MICDAKSIKYVASTLLQGKPVTHGFLTRVGGVSKDSYASLNFDARDTDTTENVEKNRALFHEAFNVPAGKLVTVSQVHGKEIFAIEGGLPEKPIEADAIVTNQTGVAIGMMTADCQPVLLFDPVNRAIGAVHAGWKGSALGIVVETVLEMHRLYGTNPEELMASTGPCIGPCCYKVGWNVLDEYMARHKEADCFTEKDGLRMDINLANTIQLALFGLKKENISNDAVCTACNSDLFFSYRKDNGRTGRQLSFIMLNNGTNG
ncbi:MAG: peptidoglycan editing factor PgeF [Deltaproteobacteria bacterium]|nr:peptidoglycan editing factor PgeF [Deltaproteobacteria bacterium]